jgi:hypothetical protein
MNYGELQKLYPDFKIPFEKDAPYYIGLLTKNNASLELNYNDFVSLELIEKDSVKYKFKKFDEILAYFKEMKWDLNSIPQTSELLNSKYTLREFNNYKPNKFYTSIDLKEANWQSFKHAFELNLPNFEEWSTTQFDLHPAIAKSKSFRQYLFGNTNPKRLQRIQESMMKDIFSLFILDEDKIVGKKSDELIFEFKDSKEATDWFIHYLYVSYPFDCKINFFTVSEHTNFNEFIRIKEIIGGFLLGPRGNERKLMGVPGNRFFIHFKTLILKEELDDRDLKFTVEKNLAKWII